MTKIMLVEDDKSLREIYSIRLVAEGYNIVSAGDGEEGLALAVQEKPDLIIADVMMPKISGFDMLDILRSTPETANVKVIMMTALSSDDQRQRGEALGANKYLVKSQVGIEDVVNTVHELLQDTPNTNAASNLDTVAAIPVQQPAPGEAIAPATPNYESQPQVAAQPATVAPVAPVAPVAAMPAAPAMPTQEVPMPAAPVAPAPVMPEMPVAPVAPVAPAPAQEIVNAQLVTDAPAAPATPAAPVAEMPVMEPIVATPDETQAEALAAAQAAALAAAQAAEAPVAPEAPQVPPMPEPAPVAPAMPEAPATPEVPAAQITGNISQIPVVPEIPAPQNGVAMPEGHIPGSDTPPAVTPEAPAIEVPTAPVVEAPVAPAMEAPVAPAMPAEAPVAPVAEIPTPQISGASSGMPADGSANMNFSAQTAGGERVIQPISDMNAPSDRDRIAAEMDAILNGNEPPTDNPFNVPTPPQLNIPSEPANKRDESTSEPAPEPKPELSNAPKPELDDIKIEDFSDKVSEKPIDFGDRETTTDTTPIDTSGIDQFEKEQVAEAEANAEHNDLLAEPGEDAEVEAITPAYMNDLTSQLVVDGENNQSELDNPLAAQMARELADDPATLEAERLRETGEAKNIIAEQTGSFLSEDEINEALPDFLKSENLANVGPNIQSTPIETEEEAKEDEEESEAPKPGEPNVVLPDATI